jgi:tetratricopeptide (TPR) repeat protein
VSSGGSELNAVQLVTKGASLGELRRVEEALDCFDRALALNPRLAELWHNKGNALYKLGRVEEALDCFDRALALNPSR